MQLHLHAEVLGDVLGACDDGNVLHAKHRTASAWRRGDCQLSDCL